MVDWPNIFSSFSPCADNKRVKIANSSFSPIDGVGFVPNSNLSCNLLSISKLTHDLSGRAVFDSSTGKFQDSGLELREDN